MSKRIGILYGDNYVGTITLFTNLEKELEKQSPLKKHKISELSAAYFEDKSCINMVPFEGAIEALENGRYGYFAEELYIDSSIPDNEYETFCKFNNRYCKCAVIRY